jgi:hypothetical protein
MNWLRLRAAGVVIPSGSPNEWVPPPWQGHKRRCADGNHCASAQPVSSSRVAPPTTARPTTATAASRGNPGRSLPACRLNPAAPGSIPSRCPSHAAELTMPRRLGRSRLLAHQLPGPAGVTRGLRAEILPPRRRLGGSEANVPFIVNRRWRGSVAAFGAHRASGSGTSPLSASSCGTVSVLSRSSSA